MTIAYLLINVETGFDEEVLEELKKVEGVVEAHTIYGVYDIIAKIEVDTIDKLKVIVASRVRLLKNITRTQTMMVY